MAVAALGAALAALVVIVRLPQADNPANDESLTRGITYIQQLRARLVATSDRPATTLKTDGLQALYLARIETGLGSPFRTIEAALRDPLLPDSTREEFASGLLAVALAQRTTPIGRIVIDPFHAAVVDSVIRSHPEPRRGEETIRVGYELGVAAGAVTAAEASIATELAAVARDAAYVRRDIVKLLAAAQRKKLRPIDLLPMWRAERLFEAEQPIVTAIPWASSKELVAHGARLLDVLDAKPRDSAAVSSSNAASRPAIDASVRQVARLLAKERNAPPLPTIVQATAALGSRASAAASNEEELAAVWLGVPRMSASDQRAWARAILGAAVKLRVTAQDPVWFAGDRAPRVIELQESHGLRSITFAAGMKQAWKDYALVSIDRALTDARRVFPDLDLRGLRIHVGVKADWPARAMALHDPETRTIYFPLGSAPGVLAHELGHDLDWQVARSVFGKTGIYATDGTARRASNILAAPVEKLTGASALHRTSASRNATSSRPTEVLARHVDWITAAALASMGRSNGFLSTVQEGGDALGNVTAPEPAHVDAALSVVAATTRVPAKTVAQLQSGANDQPLVREVVARALSANLRMPWTRRPADAFDVLGTFPSALRQAAEPRLARRCVAAAARAAGEPDWVDDVHELVADARARDIIRRLETASPPRRSPMSLSSLRSGLAAGPVDPETRKRSAAQLRREIEWQLANAMVRPLDQAAASATANCSD
jgi:hypothetical protein